MEQIECNICQPTLQQSIFQAIFISFWEQRFSLIELMSCFAVDTVGLLKVLLVKVETSICRTEHKICRMKLQFFYLSVLPLNMNC